MRARALRRKPRELTPRGCPKSPWPVAAARAQSHPGSASAAQPARLRSLRHLSRGVGALPHHERPISAPGPRSDVAARCWAVQRRTISHEKNGARAKAGERPASLGSAVEREQQTGPQSATDKLRTEAGTADSERLTRRSDFAQLAVSPAQNGLAHHSSLTDCNNQPLHSRGSPAPSQNRGMFLVRWNDEPRSSVQTSDLAHTRPNGALATLLAKIVAGNAYKLSRPGFL